jgi:hypothetical protein
MDTVPPVQAVGGPHAQPRHVCESSALAPAVLLLGKSAGQSFAPSFVTQLWKPRAVDGAQARPAPQPLDGGTWHIRPPDALFIGPAFAAQDVGAAWVIFAKAPTGTVTDAPSGPHAGESEGMFDVVAAIPHVASVVTESVKLPFAHEPPTPEQEHEQLGVPSPLITRRSVAVVPFGHVDCENDVKSTGVQPAATAWHVQPVFIPPSPVAPSIAAASVAASGPSKLRSGSELHATTTADATSANSGKLRRGTDGA